MEQIRLEHATDDSHRVLRDGHKSLRLKVAFLLPLALVLLSLILVFAWLVHEKTNSDIDSSIRSTMRDIDIMLQHRQAEQTSMLKAVSHIIMQDERIGSALASGDRKTLLKLTTPMFGDISREHHVTHFYFHNAERINLLRLHQQERYGDKIDRYTLLEAQATRNPSSGIELGALGTFTLRHVEPWYDAKSNKLIGFLELGMEIDTIFESITKFYRAELYLLIHKEYLHRETWESGMRMLDKKAVWDQMSDNVMSNYRGATDATIADRLIEQINLQKNNKHQKFRINYKGRLYEAAPLSISDVSGRDIGELWVLVDIQQVIAKSKELTTFASMISALLGIVLFILFYRQVSRVEEELQGNHARLLEIATHDGLTALYNRKSFDSILHSEISRAQRYNRQLSLLLLDVDQFKEINDTFGHPAGDQVLNELAFDLHCNLRENDHAARYGGDEFAIILSETSLDNAVHLAERIRRAVEKQNYIIHEDTICKITLSIGVATCPEHEECREGSLLHDADRALYIAKHGGRNRVCTLTDDNVES